MFMRSRVGKLAVAVVTTLAATSFVAIAPPGGASTAETQDGIDWMLGNQQADGGFEVAGFPGFETPDATLAIAQHAQSGTEWNAAEALAAVNAVEYGGAGGPTPLDYLDDFAEGAYGALSAGQSAKLIVLNAAPLGLSSTAFDPSSDGTAVDLKATLDSGYNAGSYGTFNATLFGALAHYALGEEIPAATTSLIEGAQQAGGGWDYAGDSSGSIGADVDTTSLGILALVAGGATAGDAAIDAAVAYLASDYAAAGGWESWGAFSPNATSMGILALTAADIDFSSDAWITAAGATAPATYTDPDAALLAYQTESGEFASWGNTFGTSQAVQALLRNWLPFVPDAPAPTGDSATVSISGIASVDGELTSGDIRISRDMFGVASVTGSGTIDTIEGSVPVTFGVQRLWILPWSLGTIRAGTARAELWFATVGYDAATNSAFSTSSWFDFGTWQAKTVTWSATDIS